MSMIIKKKCVVNIGVVVYIEHGRDSVKSSFVNVSRFVKIPVIFSLVSSVFVEQSDYFPGKWRARGQPKLFTALKIKVTDAIYSSTTVVAYSKYCLSTTTTTTA